MPSQRSPSTIAWALSATFRSASVSSMRSTNTPACLRA
jgi:hypothetical protein